MTTPLILNLIFATAIVASLVSLLAWAIATQFRDHGGQAVADSREVARRAPSGRLRPAYSQARRVHARQGHGLA